MPLIDRCIFFYSDWDEIEEPVLCLGKHFEKTALEQLKQQLNPTHPVTRGPDKIVFYPDKAMEGCQKLKKKQ